MLAETNRPPSLTGPTTIGGADHEIAHQLHDIVLPHLAALEIRYGREVTVPGAEVCDVIADLKAMLREVQVRTLAGSGNARLIDLIQPAVVLATRHSVAVAQWPDVAEWPEPLGGSTALLAQRFVNCAVGNAVEAGATTVGIGAVRRGTNIELEVWDDAGGFDATNLPPGRGLDRLRRSIGDENFRIRRHGAGSCLTVLVAT